MERQIVSARTLPTHAHHAPRADARHTWGETRRPQTGRTRQTSTRTSPQTKLHSYTIRRQKLSTNTYGNAARCKQQRRDLMMLLLIIADPHTTWTNAPYGCMSWPRKTRGNCSRVSRERGVRLSTNSGSLRLVAQPCLLYLPPQDFPIDSGLTPRARFCSNVSHARHRTVASPVDERIPSRPVSHLMLRSTLTPRTPPVHGT